MPSGKRCGPLTSTSWPDAFANYCASKRAPRWRQSLDRHRRHVSFRSWWRTSHGRASGGRGGRAIGRPSRRRTALSQSAVGPDSRYAANRHWRSRRLKRLDKDHGPEELQLDDTIDESARNGGEIELVFGPPRRNRIKLLLLMDVGGSMDPHTHLCERLFSAVHAANHFRKFEHRFFHNCVYERLYTDMHNWKGEPTVDVLKNLDHTWSAVLVGDAWMAPSELTHLGGALSLHHRNADTGLAWLQRIRDACRTRSG